jgi:hypothetical protein
MNGHVINHFKKGEGGGVAIKLKEPNFQRDGRKTAPVKK